MAAQFHLSLPPKPNVPLPELLQSSSFPEPSPTSTSTPPKAFCTICTIQYAKYTCPGCSMRTCSMPCSSSHKAKTGCTGLRNKAAYIPANQYGWGTMVSDYTFLEEMSRKVGDWGKEIVTGGYASAQMNARGRGIERGRGRGMRGRGRGGGGPGTTKRDTLKIQLEARDIDLDLLPVGMEKRKLNQSSWDPKNQTALLTIEFKFYKPKDPLAPSSTLQDQSFTLLTHKNDMKTPLLPLIRSRLVEGVKSKKESAHPEWVRRLVFPDAEDPESFTNPQCVMAAKIDPMTLKRLVTPAKGGHYSLDPTQPLSASLRHTEFVEFPTIEIWDEFLGTILDARGIVKQHEERPQKRRKMNPRAGRAAISGLVGGYGSSDEEEQDEEPKNMLASLDAYAGSDEDGAVVYGVNGGPDDADFGALSDEDTEEVEINPAALLELMAKVRGGEPWIVDEDEAVDWGDADD